MGTKQIRTELLKEAFREFHNGTTQDAESLVELLYEYTLPALSKPEEKEKLRLVREEADLEREKVLRQGLNESNGEYRQGAKDGILRDCLRKGDATYSWSLLQYLNRILQKKGLIEE